MKKLELYKITADVIKSLQEDLGSGDVTSLLLPAEQSATAQIVTRENMILCGQPWVNETLRMLNQSIEIKWYYQDGQLVTANQTLCQLHGITRDLLTAERVMLNFIQTLSATATLTNSYIKLIADLPVKILDTRKTLPGLRYAQKYAVTCGGGTNHRHGLYDAFLIKENHIKACGSIAAAVAKAKTLAGDKLIEVEVTNLEEFGQAEQAKPQVIMLDNFTLSDIQQAMTARMDNTIKIEVSGGVNLASLRSIAETGVDYISLGALTKNIQAIDLTMLLI